MSASTSGVTRRAVKRGWRSGNPRVPPRRRAGSVPTSPPGRSRLAAAPRTSGRPPSDSGWPRLARSEGAPCVEERRSSSGLPTRHRPRRIAVGKSGSSRGRGREVRADARDRHVDGSLADRRARDASGAGVISVRRRSGRQPDGVTPGPEKDLEVLGLQCFRRDERARRVPGGPCGAAADPHLDPPVAIVGRDLDLVGRSRLADRVPGGLAGGEAPARSGSAASRSRRWSQAPRRSAGLRRSSRSRRTIWLRVRVRACARRASIAGAFGPNASPPTGALCPLPAVLHAHQASLLTMPRASIGRPLPAIGRR